MKPAAFTYYAPKSLEEAIATLADVAPKDGRIIAGGQSLVPAMAFRLAKPEHLVDINAVPELSRIAVQGQVLSIGATVRHAAFHKPVVDGPLGRLLATVVKHIAHYPVRTRGTFCGSLAHADPASEWCLVAATLEAEIVARSKRGTRSIAAPQYFQGIMATALEPDELITEARLPLLPNGTAFGFYEFSRRAGDFAIGMALVTYRLDNGKIADPRVGIGGIEGMARRIAAAEAALKGQAPSASVFAAAADAVASAVDPIEDAQTTADYRRDLARIVTLRALERATV